MAGGVRQDTKELTRAIEGLEKRITKLERKAPSQLKVVASSTYDSTDVSLIINKINEIIRTLG